MRLTLAAVAAALFLAGCGADEPDLEACRDAMREQFAEALESGAEGQRPAACEGVSDEQLEQFAEEILGEQFEG